VRYRTKSNEETQSLAGPGLSLLSPGPAFVLRRLLRRSHIRARSDGSLRAVNEDLERKPGLLNEDAFGRGWMLIVRAGGADWRNGLTTGNAVAPAFAAFIAAEGHKTRADKP
jgi:hypothetical protein